MSGMSFLRKMWPLAKPILVKACWAFAMALATGVVELVRTLSA
jgi:hypothetical protein